MSMKQASLLMNSVLAWSEIKADNSEGCVWADSGKYKSGDGIRKRNPVTRSFTKHFIG